MEDSKIEALHYGGGLYSVGGGGVELFCRSKGFRGVIYRDATTRTWTYGNLNEELERPLRRCD
jgi:hypothetical protein